MKKKKKEKKKLKWFKALTATSGSTYPEWTFAKRIKNLSWKT